MHRSVICSSYFVLNFYRDFMIEVQMTNVYIKYVPFEIKNY